jgi:hypothetical protein
MCPKDKLFRGYIDLEIQLREFDHCRRLYEKFLEFGPDNCTTWIKVSTKTSVFCLNLFYYVNSLLNWKVFWVMLNVHVRSMNLLLNNQDLICRNCYGKHLLILKLNNKNMNERENYILNYLKELNMLK